MDDDGWDVLAEMNGPGAITRIWSGNPDGNIRIVLDGATVIEAPFEELLSGELTPLAEPLVFQGMNCYFPFGFNESCKVVCRASTSCYQINYVQFPAGTQVQRFTRELDEKAQAALAEVKRVLEKGLTEQDLRKDRKTMPVAIQQDILAGDVLCETLDGAGTLRALYVTLTDKSAPRDTYALHRCLLRIYVDGEKEPSVAAPLVDFFGAGFDLVPFRSLAIGTDKKLRIPLPERGMEAERGLTGFMYCHFPMPYRDGLRIEIQNLNETRKPIGLLVYMLVEQAPPAEDALRFNAGFHREDPCRVLDYPILRATGRGRLVGCVLDIDCPRATWWGAGDEKIWIDGRKFPAYFGTGTADYLGHARGQPSFVGALVGFTRASAYGKSSAYRWHIPDAINFQKSINFTLENLPEGGVQDTYYGSVVYWYAEPGAKHSFKPLTLADLTPPGLRIPGAVEVETNVITADWGNPVAERHYPGVQFSGQVAAELHDRGPGAAQDPVRCGPAAGPAVVADESGSFVRHDHSQGCPRADGRHAEIRPVGGRDVPGGCGAVGGRGQRDVGRVQSAGPVGLLDHRRAARRHARARMIARSVQCSARALSRTSARMLPSPNDRRCRRHVPDQALA